mgnify:CR=1 FL=1
MYLPVEGIADRCITCHNPDKLATSSTIHAQHPWQEFACTTCHQGNGRSLEFSRAHGGNGLAGDELALSMIESARSSCTICHSQKYTATRKDGPDEGRILAVRLGCAECHSIPGLPSSTERLDLPSLVHKLRPTYLVALLKQQKPLVTVTRSMPYFALSDEDATDLAGYCQTLSIYREYGSARSGDYEEGKRTFEKLGCSLCHVTRQHPGGGDTGPSLVGLWAQAKRNWLSEWLKSPRSLRPYSEMPVYQFSEDDITHVISFLMVVGGADPYAGNVRTEDPQRGAELFDRHMCLACHTTDGRSLERKIGPGLSGIASRPEWLIPLRDLPSDFRLAATRLGRFDAWLSGVAGFSRYTGREVSMPNFMLADKERMPLAEFLLSQRSATGPRLMSNAPFRSAAERGRILFNRGSCAVCHSVAPVPAGLSREEGKSKAVRLHGPNLNSIGIKVREGWLLDWLAQPESVLARARMPNPMLDPHEISDLAAYLVTLKGSYADSPLPSSLGVPANARRDATEGENLFRTYSCFRCHIIEGRGIAAYTGPELSNIGVKLRPQFVALWLKRAGDIQPDTDMDDFEMPEGDAMLIFRFLETLRKRPAK